MEERKLEFHRLFVKTYPKLLVYACRLVGENEAEDLVQDVFINFWTNGYMITSDGQSEKILFRSVYNRALNIQRHKKVSEKYSENIRYLNKELMYYYNPDRPEAIARIENAQLGKKIYDAVEELPDKCKKAFTLKYIYGLPEKEISKIMEISIRTVQVHIYRAIHFLRNRLSALIVLIAIFINWN